MKFHGVDYGQNKYEFYLDMWYTPRIWRDEVLLDIKGGIMLVIWSNCNSMMSSLVPIEGGEIVQLDGLKNARSCVGMMISCADDEFMVYK